MAGNKKDSPPRFLIVDDDQGLNALLAEYFAQERISLTPATDGASGLAQALDGGFDLVILDVMLPRLDGFEVLRQLRRRSTVPVIMLTARRERDDRIAGLEAGADDYLPKPFDPEELLARARAVLRRLDRQSATREAVIEIGPLTLDPNHRTVHLAGRPLEITAFEFEILDLLVRPPGRIVTRDEIAGALYQRPAQPYERSLDVHISRLRQKLGVGGIAIRSVRGVGYLLSVRE